MNSIISKFLYSERDYPFLTVFAAGLYPFLHYFNSNLHISNSWYQLMFMLLLCFVLPFTLLGLSKFVFKIKPLKQFESKRLTLINLTVFLVLIGFLIFNFKKKATVLLIFVACILAFVLYKHLKKVIILQLVLAIMSMITLVPLLSFAWQQNNDDWAKVSNEIIDTKFKSSPNIFVIQPDGYVNVSELVKPPYNYDNSDFYEYLNTEGFTNYSNFRSNYFSTLTSNASMFAMKHHFYSNTYKKGHKTLNANKVIVGTDNTVLNILKSNNYKTHLITDNSYFSIDRVPMIYDYHNISEHQVSFIKSETIKTDILSDVEEVLDTLSLSQNFFFIEKIAPSHIVRNPGLSKGIKGERDAYIERLKETNTWLKSLILNIKQFDEDALVVIVADHGGFVGLNHTLESVQKPLNEEEIKSVFSAMLSIKWPNELQTDTLSFKSNVNLFRNLFYALSVNHKLIENQENNNSYIPFYDNGIADYYECIDSDGKVILYGKPN